MVIPLKTARPVPPNKLDINSAEKIENETESAIVPSSPTKNKDKNISPENAQNEKPKTVKKVKVKVKKVIMIVCMKCDCYFAWNSHITKKKKSLLSSRLSFFIYLKL